MQVYVYICVIRVNVDAVWVLAWFIFGDVALFTFPVVKTVHIFFVSGEEL